MKFKTVTVTTKEQLDKLYEAWALTLEGLTTDEENLKAFAEWLEWCRVDTTNLEFWIIDGKVMNKHYKLKGNNKYPDDLHIVSTMGIDTSLVILRRFELGGRWFTDIVDNNTRRNGE